MRGKDGEEIVALIPTDTDLVSVAAVLRALTGAFKGAMVRDVGHCGTYIPKQGRSQGVMEVFVPVKEKRISEVSTSKGRGNKNR
jgi:hypothetical protein